MNILTLSVATREDVTRRALDAFDGRDQGFHISFSSVEMLRQTLTRERWELMKAMTGRGAIGLREASRLVERDGESVHADVRVLLDAGVIQRDSSGGVVFPFEAVHLDFTLFSADDS